MNDDDPRMPPMDIEAEQSVLGAMLLSPNAAALASGQLSMADFARPAHREIFKAAADLYQRGVPVEVMSVRAELERTGAIGKAGGALYVAELSRAVVTAVNAGFYVGRVREVGLKRALVEEFTRLASMGYSPAIESDELIATADATLNTLRTVGTDDAIPGLSTFGSFVDEADQGHDWIVPGLLERMDRVIVVASEGAGKTTLARQMTVMLSAGVHPFSWHARITPVRTLYIDLENPPPLVRRKGRQLVNQGRTVEGWDDDRCWRWTRPGGIDLRKPHDQALVERAIAETGAQFVALGPLYKSFLEGGEKAETVNGQVARILDRFRERYGVALWLETHAPMEQNGQRSLRPLGSGVWTRWPEFGLALRKSSKHPHRVDVGRFRGDRDERAWPHHLERSSPWPWAPVWDGGFPIEEASGT
ncbi:DnaB-like helicase N-terminal domain-containing protein [Nonomuraea sp. NPDC050451]|uniref:DnaB-like helicase N-terminal domain-containing protein n=1 Tax=Nonomuraea sp. NPDC050451 TaxID=3364364 RepID=UPI003787FFDA